jgi:hypothetical protein
MKFISVIFYYYIVPQIITSIHIYCINTGCFKTSFTNMKVYINLFRGHVQCLNVAKQIEFYLVELRFNVTSTGNAGYFKKSLTMVFIRVFFPIS